LLLNCVKKLTLTLVCLFMVRSNTKSKLTKTIPRCSRRGLDFFVINIKSEAIITLFYARRNPIHLHVYWSSIFSSAASDSLTVLAAAVLTKKGLYFIEISLFIASIKSATFFRIIHCSQNIKFV
jgi:hypothetical protein